MKKLITPFTCAIALMACSYAGLAHADPYETQHCRVVSVHDGDSLRVECPGERRSVRVRMGQIDAPELDQAYGRQARDHLRRLCPVRSVAAIYAQGKDQYGRLVGHVYCKGKSVNQEMVGSGSAWFYHRHADPERAEDRLLYRLQDNAQRQGRGLWAERNPEPPWRWRHRQRQGAR